MAITAERHAGGVESAGYAHVVLYGGKTSSALLLSAMNHKPGHASLGSYRIDDAIIVAWQAAFTVPPELASHPPEEPDTLREA